MFTIVRELLDEGTLKNPLLKDLLDHDKIKSLKDLDGLKKFEIS